MVKAPIRRVPVLTWHRGTSAARVGMMNVITRTVLIVVANADPCRTTLHVVKVLMSIRTMIVKNAITNAPSKEWNIGIALNVPTQPPTAYLPGRLSGPVSTLGTAPNAPTRTHYSGIVYISVTRTTIMSAIVELTSPCAAKPTFSGVVAMEEVPPFTTHLNSSETRPETFTRRNIMMFAVTKNRIVSVELTLHRDRLTFRRTTDRAIAHAEQFGLFPATANGRLHIPRLFDTSRNAEAMTFGTSRGRATRVNRRYPPVLLMAVRLHRLVGTVRRNVRHRAVR